MFQDEEKIASYALEKVKKVVEAGIMKGDTDGNFRPTEPITRQDVAVVLANLLKFLGK